MCAFLYTETGVLPLAYRRLILALKYLQYTVYCHCLPHTSLIVHFVNVGFFMLLESLHG